MSVWPRRSAVEGKDEVIIKVLPPEAQKVRTKPVKAKPGKRKVVEGVKSRPLSAKQKSARAAEIKAKQYAKMAGIQVDRIVRDEAGNAVRVEHVKKASKPS